VGSKSFASPAIPVPGASSPLDSHGGSPRTLRVSGQTAPWIPPWMKTDAALDDLNRDAGNLIVPVFGSAVEQRPLAARSPFSARRGCEAPIEFAGLMPRPAGAASPRAPAGVARGGWSALRPWARAWLPSRLRGAREVAGLTPPRCPHDRRYTRRSAGSRHHLAGPRRSSRAEKSNAASSAPSGGDRSRDHGHRDDCGSPAIDCRIPVSALTFSRL
jgi:hypothetical protein